MKHPLQWTLLAAQKEFGTHRDTLKAKLTQAGEKADEQDCYSTAQICNAIYSDLVAEKIGLTRAQRIKEETANRQRAGELVEVSQVVELAQRFCFAARQKILLATMPEEEKQALLVDIGRLGEADYSQMPTDEKDAGA